MEVCGGYANHEPPTTNHQHVTGERRRRLAAGYFIVQAFAVIAWWMVLAVSPAVRAYFALREAPMAALGAFAPGDLVLVAVGSLVVGVRRGHGWSGPLGWMIAGAMIYAAAYTVSIAVVGLSPPFGAVLMVPAALASLVAASQLTRHAVVERVPTGPAA